MTSLSLEATKLFTASHDLHLSKWWPLTEKPSKQKNDYHAILTAWFKAISISTSQTILKTFKDILTVSWNTKTSMSIKLDYQEKGLYLLHGQVQGSMHTSQGYNLQILCRDYELPTAAYSGLHIKITITWFMKQMTYSWPSILQFKNVTMLWSSWLHFNIDWSFKMRYSINFYPNWYRNYEVSNLNMCFLLSKFKSFNFDHS